MCSVFSSMKTTVETLANIKGFFILKAIFLNGLNIKLQSNAGVITSIARIEQLMTKLLLLNEKRPI